MHKRKPPRDCPCLLSVQEEKEREEAESEEGKDKEEEEENQRDSCTQTDNTGMIQVKECEAVLL